MNFKCVDLVNCDMWYTWCIVCSMGSCISHDTNVRYWSSVCKVSVAAAAVWPLSASQWSGSIFMLDLYRKLCEVNECISLVAEAERCASLWEWITSVNWTACHSALNTTANCFLLHHCRIAKYCDEYVCLSVHLSVCLLAQFKNCAARPPIFVHVTCSHGSVL